MNYLPKDHTFVICTYKESRFLENCILSLTNQSIKTNIILATSTPNEYVLALANKYQIPVFINTYGVEHGSDIATDWNFALSKVKTSLATIAHQDDLYKENYTKEILEAANKCDRPLIVFSDYSEVRDNTEITDNKLLKIKRTLLTPLKHQRNWKSVFWRRRALSIGNVICCPAVTYCLPNVTQPIFTKGFKSNIDWEAWEKLSRLNGEFAFVNEVLMSHRIHEDSTTTEVIADEGRGGEDLAMFRKFWPNWISNIIECKYKTSEDQNTLIKK